MKLDTLGETFFDGRIINLDNPSLDILDTSLEKIKQKKEDLELKLNDLIVEMQK